MHLCKGTTAHHNIMSGKDYLLAIKQELLAGRHQHRMGENVLAAFGYVRRRRGVVDEINAVLEELQLTANPPIGQDMPLRNPRIRFSITSISEPPPDQPWAVTTNDDDSGTGQEPGEEQPDASFVSSFRVAELAAADKPVECVSPQAEIAEAYTRMGLCKYSQLVVANSPTARRQDIKGIVSYESIAKALLAGKEPSASVIECTERTVSILHSGDDLNKVLSELGVHDVVLVVGHDNRLQGIITAWDLAEEFAELVEAFKRIGEIEGRIRALLERRLGLEQINQFLIDHPPGEVAKSKNSTADLTIGDLQSLVEHPKSWNALRISAIHRPTFVEALNRVGTFRNRLMHFRDPLSADELHELTNFCGLVREIPA